MGKGGDQAEVPKIKGVAVLSLLPALKAVPGAAETVPADLQHYLQDAILPSAWYPERDFDRLVETLARNIDPTVLGGESVWSFFGRVAAQRDIAGMQNQVPNRSRSDVAGTYRHLRSGNPKDLALIFGRLKAVWRLYRDTGRLTIARHSTAPYTIVLRVVDYTFSSPGTIAIQSAYANEAARLLGVQMEGELVRSKAQGDPYYEWHYRVAAIQEHADALQLLPVADE